MMEFVPGTSVIKSGFLEEAVGTATTVSGVSGRSGITSSNIISLSLEPEGWLASCSPTAISETTLELNSYIATDLLDFMPESDLEEKIYSYEDEYGISSKDFYQEWLSGKFQDTPETNEWASLLSQLRNYQNGRDIGK